MATNAESPSESADVVVIEATTGWASGGLAELWRYRELIGFFALRDIRVRYKQSILGFAWAVIEPVMTMVVFTVLFSLMLAGGRLPAPEGVPYPVSTLCALVIWQLFARVLTASSNSLVANQNLITKVHFPRLIAPIAPIFAALVDFFVAFAVLVLVMAGFALLTGYEPGLSGRLLALPLFVALAIATALSISLWLSALNAIYRDVRHTVPFLLQIGMYSSATLYTTESISSRSPEWLPAWVWTVYGLNPMVSVVEGFRWALLGANDFQWGLLGTSSLVVSIFLCLGLQFFKRMERSFVDLV